MRDDLSRWLVYRDAKHEGWWILEYCAWGTGDGFIARAPSRKEAFSRMDEEIKNEITGGPKRYTHQQYGIGSIVDYDPSEVRYFKKPWVPEWLFRWFANPDMVALLDLKMSQAKERYEKDLQDRIAR